MSWANDVKMELTRRAIGPRHCVLAELAALISYCGRISQVEYGNGSGSEKGDFVLTLETEQLSVIQRYEALLEDAFALERGAPVTGDVAKRVLQALKMEGWLGNLHEQDCPVSSLLLQSNCCKRAFLAGVFLCQGTMSTPEKQYHLEYSCGGARKAEQLIGLIGQFHVEARVTVRKQMHVVYVKEADRISDLLTVMQAMVAVMNFENIRVRREIKGNINRRVNCETANIGKTVNAAMEQIADIELIRDRLGLNSLPQELYDTAMMRLQYQDLSLKALGALMDPPVGKSGMNHRFQKMKKMALEIRENEGRV